ncbi:hypothetical protein DL546_009309 [Coniochaeta pulveracea]|uniref:Uncharacterized protein n=1 Tax=Coniochaeta pulveracea TaxID=177199 RepID=A0A420YNW0_9PEZI|nr:hypothetical protein DL546_009309 [Coniochaeta pulveracea]
MLRGLVQDAARFIPKMDSFQKSLQKLKRDFPWLELPLVSNAPMSGFAGGDLAVAVARGGGLGQIGFTGTVGGLREELEKVKKNIPVESGNDESTAVLPVGVGFIVVNGGPRIWLDTLTRYRPAMVWLSFGGGAEFQTWASAVRAVSPNTKIWVQIGSVAAALEAVTACKPDALVLQGSDAGGHGHKNGASIISLLPEVSDALEQRNIDDVALIAAGGIADGRGAAAALMLGAGGVVMGTRFLAATETVFEPEFRDLVLSAADGGVSTVRSRVFDDIYGQNGWPEMYDGRCMRNAMYDNLEKGLSVEEIRDQIYRQASSSDSTSVRDSVTLWAGTGIGLVRKMESATEIVRETQLQMKAMVGGINAVVNGSQNHPSY